MDPKKVRKAVALTYTEGDFVDQGNRAPWSGWTKHNQGINGVGPTTDQNYGTERPRGYEQAKARFRRLNPEFQDGASDGDWTTWNFSPNV